LSRAKIGRLESALNERTLQLAATNRQLKKQALEQRAAKAKLKGTGSHYANLLEDSLKLQNGLRELSHQLIRAEERDRKRFSKKLQMEIVQALVAVNVGLITLGKDAQKATAGVVNDVNEMQVLATTSARTMRKSAERLSLQ
jgi:signal transduction histidine kinase